MDFFRKEMLSFLPFIGGIQVLLQPYNYLASRPGKEIRSQLIEALNVWLQVPEDKIKVIHKVIGMLHTSSLLCVQNRRYWLSKVSLTPLLHSRNRVDDVEDNSTLRRGAPVAHAVYGVPQTINTANYVYFLVFAEVFALSKADDNDGPSKQQQQKRVEEMIVEEMVNLHRGQGMDLYWRDNLICPTEAEYIEMVNNKTSGLLRIVIKLMVANSPIFNQASQSGKDSLIPLVNLIGLLFQVRDDYMNLRSGDYAENKGYCEDLTEGKFSFPIIHSIRASPACSQNGIGGTQDNHTTSNGHADIQDQQHLLSILQCRPKDAKTKRDVVEYMKDRTNSFDYTCDVMTRLDKLVQEETTLIEAKLGGGQVNARLRGIIGALRKGWYQ